MQIIPSIKMWNFESMYEKIELLLESEARVFRINLKTLSVPEEFIALQKEIKNILINNEDVRFLLDVDIPNESPRIRILNEDFLEVKRGEKIILKIGTPMLGDYIKTIYLSSLDLSMERIREARYVIYSDGAAVFKISFCRQNMFTLVAMQNCYLWSGKSIHFDCMCLISGEKLCMEKKVINSIPPQNIYSIALSFTQNAEQIDNVESILGKKKYICKIEDAQGIANIDKILQHKLCYGIYIARGDLLFSIYEDDFCNVQEYCVRRAYNYNKISIIGTDILESLKSRAFPTRSDMTDWCFIKRLNPSGVVLSSALAYSDEISSIIKFMKKPYKYSGSI